MLPAVPLTIEGSWVLHQMFRVDHTFFRGDSTSLRKRHLVRDLAAMLSEWEGNEAFPSAVYGVISHKADLMVIHFREDPGELLEVRRAIDSLAISGALVPVYSYLSVVELGLYESSVKIFKSLAERGVEQHSDEWKAALQETMDRQREAMRSRLYPTLPSGRYACFYPMDRLRGEQKNWYSESIEERQRMMHEHGLVGRRYAGEVKQIITGSVGLDDWEWGVDLFSDDPLVFKRLIYEMRFDEVSAVYAKFGPFFVGTRVAAARLEEFLVA